MLVKLNYMENVIYLFAFFWCDNANVLSFKPSKSARHNDFRSLIVSAFVGSSLLVPFSNKIFTENFK